MLKMATMALPILWTCLVLAAKSRAGPVDYPHFPKPRLQEDRGAKVMRAACGVPPHFHQKDQDGNDKHIDVLRLNISACLPWRASSQCSNVTLAFWEKSKTHPVVGDIHQSMLVRVTGSGTWPVKGKQHPLLNVTTSLRDEKYRDLYCTTTYDRGATIDLVHTVRLDLSAIISATDVHTTPQKLDLPDNNFRAEIFRAHALKVTWRPPDPGMVGEAHVMRATGRHGSVQAATRLQEAAATIFMLTGQDQYWPPGAGVLASRLLPASAARPNVSLDVLVESCTYCSYTCSVPDPACVGSDSYLCVCNALAEEREEEEGHSLLGLVIFLLVVLLVITPIVTCIMIKCGCISVNCRSSCRSGGCCKLIRPPNKHENGILYTSVNQDSKSETKDQSTQRYIETSEKNTQFYITVDSKFVQTDIGSGQKTVKFGDAKKDDGDVAGASSNKSDVSCPDQIVKVVDIVDIPPEPSLSDERRSRRAARRASGASPQPDEPGSLRDERRSRLSVGRASGASPQPDDSYDLDAISSESQGSVFSSSGGLPVPNTEDDRRQSVSQSGGRPIQQEELIVPERSREVASTPGPRIQSHAERSREVYRNPDLSQPDANENPRSPVVRETSGDGSVLVNENGEPDSTTLGDFPANGACAIPGVKCRIGRHMSYPGDKSSNPQTEQT